MSKHSAHLEPDGIGSPLSLAIYILFNLDCVHPQGVRDLSLTAFFEHRGPYKPWDHNLYIELNLPHMSSIKSKKNWIAKETQKVGVPTMLSWPVIGGNHKEFIKNQMEHSFRQEMWFTSIHVHENMGHSQLHFNLSKWFVNIVLCNPTTFLGSVLNSSPIVTYMRQWTGSALVQVMACHLYGLPMLAYC